MRSPAGHHSELKALRANHKLMIVDEHFVAHHTFSSGGLVGKCTCSEQIRSRIINSTEYAAAAAYRMTNKAAVSAALASTLCLTGWIIGTSFFRVDCSLHGISSSQSNRTQEKSILMLKFSTLRVARIPAGTVDEEMWHTRAGSFVPCSLSVYMLKMMLLPSAYGNCMSLTDRTLRTQHTKSSLLSCTRFFRRETVPKCSVEIL